jgi:hypothetical protein
MTVNDKLNPAFIIFSLILLDWEKILAYGGRLANVVNCPAGSEKVS